ncbi:hypothetical protein ACMA1I_06490 [Pontibacter sp. 13R65]|uniref:hypothetical protein n=1 Tax=Pontibacter sp. 13R65 TaxID=3127458 RepID=UPI00301B6FA9
MERKINRNILCCFALLLISTLVAFQKAENKKYFRSPTILVKYDRIDAHFVAFGDSTSNDTLYQVWSKDNYPVAYFREIKTGVCFDNKCRQLDVVLYWNITGRYLGFELPQGEYLSKTDHEPFTEQEYEQLSDILADKRSPLANFTYNQVVQEPVSKLAGLDGITSATSPAVLEHVVPGAAYTTYKLWHLVYGSAQAEVMRFTRMALSPELMLQILNSPDESDVMWALHHIKGYVPLSPKLSNKILGFINTENYSLSERAIYALDPVELTSDSLQFHLLQKFYESDYSIKKLIIDKLKEAPELNSRVKEKLAGNLAQLNGEIISRVLEVFKRHKLTDVEAYRKVAELLQDENDFISKKAFDFLRHEQVKEEGIQKQLKEYGLKHDVSLN